jgi:hypothetical protein
MHTCPECDETLDNGDAEAPNVDFVEMRGLRIGGRAPKEIYLVACGNCRKAIGTSISASWG